MMLLQMIDTDDNNNNHKKEKQLAIDRYVPNKIQNFYLQTMDNYKNKIPLGEKENKK